MSFDEEWARLHAAAAQRKQADPRMQLAGYGPENRQGAGIKTLKVTPKVLRTKAGDADRIRGDIKQVDDDAMGKTRLAKESLKGFACADAFDAFEERWNQQLVYVQGTLEQKVAGALRKAATLFEISDRFPVEGDGRGEKGSGQAPG